jgi:hypothetical protein
VRGIYGHRLTVIRNKLRRVFFYYRNKFDSVLLISLYDNIYNYVYNKNIGSNMKAALKSHTLHFYIYT